MPQTADAGLRLAIYARVSTEEQREGQTIDSQLSELERFSREKGWLISAIYKDDGWSGGVMERPELDRLRDDAQKGVFQAVLINDVDRLARDVAHLGVIKRDLERKGIRVIFRKLPSEESPTYNLMVNILGSFAEFERELIADRVRRGRRHKVEVRKLYLGSNTAYGYRYRPMDRVAGTSGVLEICSPEARVVRQMFEWVDSEGLSARRVMLRLNELKVVPRQGAAHWAKSSVLRILHCETYAGVWHYNKHQGCEPKNPTTSPRYRKRAKCSVRVRPKSEWLPLELDPELRIVPRDRWERVQQQLARNLTFSPRNEHHAYLLKGLVRCGGCGARYIGDPCHGKFYYRCIERCKRMPTVKEHLLDDAVMKAVRRVILDPKVILEPLQKLQEAEAREKQTGERVKVEIEKATKRMHVEEQRMLDAYRSGIISPAQLADQLEKLRAERAAFDLRRAEAERAAEHPPEEAAHAVSDFCAEAARNLGSFTFEQWREFLRTIIEVITFNGSHITVRGRIPIGEVPGGEIKLDTPVA